MCTAEFKTDFMSGGFEIDLASGRNVGNRGGGLEILPSAADSHHKEQAKAV